jgi:hypothetical protein
MTAGGLLAAGNKRYRRKIRNKEAVQGATAAKEVTA